MIGSRLNYSSHHNFKPKLWVTYHEWCWCYTSHNHQNFSELQSFTNCCCCSALLFLWSETKCCNSMYVEGGGLHVFWRCSDKMEEEVFPLVSFIFSYKIIIIFYSKEKWIKKNFRVVASLLLLISKWICVTKFPIIGLLIEGSYTFKSTETPSCRNGQFINPACNFALDSPPCFSLCLFLCWATFEVA